MKILRELKIFRKSLNDWTDNIVWGKDGTIYINTQPDLTICEPTFNKNIHRQLKNMFHVREYSLPQPDNKFENIDLERNQILMSQPEPTIISCFPGPRSELLAILTNHANALLYNGNNLIGQLDDEQETLPGRAYHSLAWSLDGKKLYIGNGCNGIAVFEIGEDLKIHYRSTIMLGDKSEGKWITKVICTDTMVGCANTENEVFVIDINSAKVRLVKEASKFSIVDLIFVEEKILVSSIGSFYMFNVETEVKSEEELLPYYDMVIIPLPDKENVVLVCDKTSIKANIKKEKLVFSADDIISPVIEKKFQKWNDIYNEFPKYETKFCIRGLTLSPDGYSIAILYEIGRVSLKYSIPSEQVYHLMTIPLSESWEISTTASGLAWYQTFNITGSMPKNMGKISDEMILDTNLPFIEYLSSILNEDLMNVWKFNNFVQEEPSATKVYELVFNYGIRHIKNIDNKLDKACLLWLAFVLEKDIVLDLEPIEFNGPFIREWFDFGANTNKIIVNSELGHKWKRCCVTGLPLLSTKVKVCPVTHTCVIDIEGDTLNDYGWYTEALLRIFGRISIYTGTKMKDG